MNPVKAVFLRHATRSAHGLGDSQLNALGLRQAEELARSLKPQGPLPHPTHLMCSPKRRARETLAPLATLTQLPLIVDDRLDERHQNESARVFESRVRSLTGSVLTLGDPGGGGSGDGGGACVYLCSHLDWLEAAMILLDSDMSETEIAAPWTTAEFRVFRVEDGLWRRQAGGAIAVRG
jgi:hypothetical protein